MECIGYWSKISNGLTSCCAVIVKVRFDLVSRQQCLLPNNKMLCCKYPSGATSNCHFAGRSSNNFLFLSRAQGPVAVGLTSFPRLCNWNQTLIVLGARESNHVPGSAAVSHARCDVSGPLAACQDIRR